MKLVRQTFFVAWCVLATFSISLHAQEGSDPKVMQAARKEGEIVWYTTMSSDQSNAFMARFQQKYFLETVYYPAGWKRTAKPNRHRIQSWKALL
jgi:hypothetical protein